MPRVYVPASLPYDAVLLSSDKWASIGAHLTREREEAERLRRLREAADRRKDKSKQMQDDWPNTLAKLHAKRLLEREERLRKKEEDQLKIDAEEAEIQANLRKEKLDAAREMLFHNEERVRNLDSALLLSEVLKERDEQVALKRRLRKEEKERERQWFEHLQWDWMKQAEVEEAELMARRLANQRSDEKQKEYADNIRLKAEAMKLELEADQKVRQATEEYHKLLEQDMMKEHEKRRKMKKDTGEFIRTQRAFEALKQKRDEEENAEIRVYGRAKLEMAKGIIKQKAAILDEGRQRREAACAQLEKIINAKQDDEAARLAVVVAQKEAEWDAREAAKEAAHAAAIADLNRQRRQQVARGEAAVRRAAAAKLEERKEDHRKIELMAAELRERQQDLIDQRAQNRRDWKEQVEEVEAKRLVEKEEEYAEVHGLRSAVRQEQQKFDDYARSEIERLEINGRNTFPLKVAAKTSAPGFLRHSTDWSGVGVRPY